MILLAIESSTDRISLALSYGGRIFVRELADDSPRASEALVAKIGSLLAAQGVSVGMLDALAYDCGPGAFTSIRCGCAVAQALALANDIPLIGIPSLEALAHTQAAADRVCCALDARMGEVYIARFRKDAGVLRLDGAMECVDPTAFRLADGPWVGVGTGFAVKDGALAAANPGEFSAVFDDIRPAALAICELALQRYAAGVRGDAAAAAPLYVRDKVALTTRERLLLRK